MIYVPPLMTLYSDWNASVHSAIIICFQLEIVRTLVSVYYYAMLYYQHPWQNRCYTFQPCLIKTLLFTLALLSHILYLLFSFSLSDSCQPFQRQSKISVATGLYVMATVFAEINVMGWPDCSNEYSVVSSNNKCLKKMFPSAKNQNKLPRLMV